MITIGDNTCVTLPAYLFSQPSGIRLSIKLQPRAATNEIVGASGDELKIRVTAPPVDSAANEALLRLLSDVLQCPRNALRIERGLTSRHKQVSVHGLTVSEVLARLSK